MSWEEEGRRRWLLVKGHVASFFPGLTVLEVCGGCAGRWTRATILIRGPKTVDPLQVQGAEQQRRPKEGAQKGRSCPDQWTGQRSGVGCVLGQDKVERGLGLFGWKSNKW